LITKFSDAIQISKNTNDLGQAMFEDLKTGKKAEFALEMLALEKPDQLSVPTYIKEGLTWLQEQVRIRQKEVFISSEASTPECEKK